jgi:hypothetical protein
MHDESWPVLDYAASSETLQTLQIWMQVVGKIRLALTPWLNHSWHVPLYVTARGLGSSPIPCAGEILELEFDLIDQRLVARTSRGQRAHLALASGSVRDFFIAVMTMLRGLDIEVRIHAWPNEIAEGVPFPEDTVARVYLPERAHAFWRALLPVDRVLKQFRTGFLGKCSPVHFFWGSFDLAVTRFSGRPAPLHPGGIPALPDAVTREAYSHEVSSAGFWPGDPRYPQAAFYSYAYPAPEGFGQAQVRPKAAQFAASLGEWVLPYDALRTADDPERSLLEFLQDTYVAAAQGAHWDRAALECAPGVPGRPRTV